MTAGSIWTVGHSNHPLERFVEILRAHEIARVLSEKEARPRRLPDFARLEGTRVIYDVHPIP